MQSACFCPNYAACLANIADLQQSGVQFVWRDALFFLSAAPILLFPLWFRLLLGDAVDVAAAVENLRGVHADDFAVGEHALDLLDGELVVGVVVLGDDDAAVDNEELR